MDPAHDLLLLAGRVAVPLPGRTPADPAQPHLPVAVVPPVRHTVTTAVRPPGPCHVTGRILPLPPKTLPLVTRRTTPRTTVWHPTPTA
ncbi:hypothetical protein [Actinoallomurus acaciae]|uniref:Secreted protein n=1 Tax=Actinoallomurus acaciae TaxID=502577 RepID=A0ABV5YYZ0_9ACTN